MKWYLLDNFVSFQRINYKLPLHTLRTREAMKPREELAEKTEKAKI